jgi:hypothetical protein
MKRGTRGQATIEVSASPTTLYEVVSDVARMGEWSPECRRCVWLGGATGPVVGARFKGSNQRGMLRWSTKPRVVTADPGREFAFVTGHLGHDATKWSYEFEPTASGTKVTESFEMIRGMPFYFRLVDRWLMKITDRKADLENNMRQTLERVKVAVEL